MMCAILSEDRGITSVNNDRIKTYSNALWFWSKDKIFNHFPQNIKFYFPNLEYFYIKGGNISTITKSDLSPFGSKLKTFDFQNNLIEVIEVDLFEENPNLEVVDLKGNKIKFVAIGAFVKLPKLKKLHFNPNPCHSSGNIDNDPTAVINLVQHLESNCQDLEAYEKFKNLINTTPKTEQELLIDQLTAKIAQLEERLQLENLKDELREVKDTIMNKLKQMEDSTDAKFDSINATCVALEFFKSEENSRCGRCRP